MSNNSQATNSGTGVCGLLLIAFIVLKLTHVIDWSWWWVLSPFLIPLALMFLILAFIVILARIGKKKSNKKWNKKLSILKKNLNDGKQTD